MPKLKWTSPNLIGTLIGITLVVLGTRYWDLVKKDWKGYFIIMIGVLILTYVSISKSEIKQEAMQSK